MPIAIFVNLVLGILMFRMNSDTALSDSTLFKVSEHPQK